MEKVMDITEVYKSLGFLTESIRLQYTNFIIRNKDRINEQYLSFDDIVYRLKHGEPIEYVFNLAEFMGIRFYVDKRCLIPRVETEELVKKTLTFVEQHKDKTLTILDIGTGSGCIILSLAYLLNIQKITNVQFIALDISEDALEVARINSEALKLSNKVKLIHTGFQNFDFKLYSNVIVCSNLPYIPNTDTLQESVLNYEPHIALFGGERGDELNKLLLEKLAGKENIDAVFMEGYNGAIESIFK